MALSGQLGKAGMTAQKAGKRPRRVTLAKTAKAFSISKSHLDLVATIPARTKAKVRRSGQGGGDRLPGSNSSKRKSR